MNLVFFGGGEGAAVLLRRLAAVHAVLSVITPPPRPAGRKLAPRPPPAAECAETLGLPLAHAADAAALRRCSPDALVVCDYGKLLPPAMLSVGALGALNVHPSLLPRWRGAAPIERALLAGDARTGVSIMRMNEKLDAGDILLQEEISLTANTTGGDLHTALLSRGAELLLRVLATPADFPPAPQGREGVTYAKKLSAAERALCFAESAEINHRRVRAFSPTPGAHCELAGERLKVFAAAVVDAPAGAAPGVLLSAGGEGLVVSCGEGALRLELLQREGRRRMTAAELLRGFSLDGFVGRKIVAPLTDAAESA